MVSGQRCELREIELKRKAPEMLAASPKGTVPVLVLPEGAVIEQSMDIMKWALLQHDPEHWLFPEQGAQQTMLSLIERNDGYFKKHLDRYKYPHRYSHEHGGHEVQFAENQRASAAVWLMELDALLTRTPWLFGPTASLADMALLPFVRQFAHTDAAWFQSQPWPNLCGWLMRWENSSLFQNVMEKYPPWLSGQPGIEFPPSSGTRSI